MFVILVKKLRVCIKCSNAHISGILDTQGKVQQFFVCVFLQGFLILLFLIAKLIYIHGMYCFGTQKTSFAELSIHVHVFQKFIVHQNMEIVFCP